jgi:hypothetical protein
MLSKVTPGTQQLNREAHSRPPFAALWCGGMTPAMKRIPPPLCASVTKIDLALSINGWDPAQTPTGFAESVGDFSQYFTRAGFWLFFPSHGNPKMVLRATRRKWSAKVLALLI